MKYVFAFIFIFSITSCCKQRDCLPGHITEIDLASYQPADIDTIILRRFAGASNFHTLLDTLLLSPINSNTYPNGDTTRVYISDTAVAMKAGCDYEIYIPGANTLARLSKIVAPQKQHQVCQVCDCAQGPCFNPVTSFTLNGQVVSNDYVSLKK
jgi:hypothetical protein